MKLNTLHKAVDKVKLSNILKRDIEDKRSFWSSYRDPKGDQQEESTMSKTLASSIKGSYDIRQAYKKQHPYTVLTEESVGHGAEQSLLTPKGPKAYQAGSNTMMTSTETLAKVTSHPQLAGSKASAIRVKTDYPQSARHEQDALSIRFASPRASNYFTSTQTHETKNSKPSASKTKATKSVLNFHNRYEPKLVTSAQCRHMLTQTGTSRKRNWRRRATT